MHIAQLWEYPIKSCPGIQVQATTLALYGPARNRNLMIIDAKGMMITQRTMPKLALLKIARDDSDIIVTASNGKSVSIDLRYHYSEAVQVRLHDQPPCTGFVQASTASEFFSDFLGKQCRVIGHSRQAKRIVHSKSLDKDLEICGFPDKYPLLIVSTGSLHVLGQQLGDVFDVRRVRPNIVIDADPFEENIPVRILETGQVSLNWAKLCGRCSIPEVNPDTGIMDRSKQVTNAFKAIFPVNSDGEPVFGSNYTYTGHGVVQVGDAVHIT